MLPNADLRSRWHISTLEKMGRLTVSGTQKRSNLLLHVRDCVRREAIAMDGFSRERPQGFLTILSIVSCTTRRSRMRRLNESGRTRMMPTSTKGGARAVVCRVCVACYSSGH